MLFFEFYKIMVNKVTFVSLRGGITQDETSYQVNFQKDQSSSVEESCNLTLLRKPGCSNTQGLLFCWFYILKQCQKPVFSWLPDYQGQVEWCQSYFTKMSLKAYIYRKPGYYTAQAYLMCKKFWVPYYLNISTWFQVQNMFGRIWPRRPYKWRAFLHHDLIWRKNGSKTRMMFSTHKQKPRFGGTVYKICMLCMFRCADLLRKWLKMDVGKSKIVWSVSNGCHISQGNVLKFKVAFHPSFPDSHSVSRFPEQGF